MILLAELEVPIYHFARVKINTEGGRFFWVIFGGMGQKRCAEGHFAHPPGGGLTFVWAGLQKEPSARLMEPTGAYGLWGKGECESFTHFFLNVIILLVKRATYFAPN